MRSITPKEALLNFRKQRQKNLKVFLAHKSTDVLFMMEMDNIENALYRRALLDERVKADENRMPSRPSVFLAFKAGELRNPITLASLLARVKR